METPPPRGRHGKYVENPPRDKEYKEAENQEKLRIRLKNDRNVKIFYFPIPRERPEAAGGVDEESAGWVCRFLPDLSRSYTSAMTPYRQDRVS
jgi:hypothetical protein